MRHKLTQLTNVAALGGGALPRTFDVSPAISGKTTWNLDSDGPCTFTPAGSPYTVTPSAGFSGVIELYGASGGSGGIGATTATSGVTPSNCSMSTEGAALIAGPGVRSTLATSNTPSAGGAGGTASGGDVNTTGTAGTVGTIAATCIGGNGGAGALPAGGAGATGLSAGSGVTVAGVAGSAPGGGAAGAAHGDATSANRRATGGSGGGAYCKRTFAVGVLPAGVAKTLNVRSGGAAGTGDLAAGAAGSDGKAVIT